MSAHWEPLSKGIYFNIGERTVCELIDDTPVLDYHDMLDDILHLASTVSIVYHRERSRYADRQALLAAERVRKWGEKLKNQEPTP